MIICVLFISNDLAIDSIVSGVLDRRLRDFIRLLVEKCDDIFAPLIVCHTWQLDVKVEIEICVIISRCLSLQGLHLDFLRKYTHSLHFAFLNELDLIHPAEQSAHCRAEASLWDVVVGYWHVRRLLMHRWGELGRWNIVRVNCIELQAGHSLFLLPWPHSSFLSVEGERVIVSDIE